MKQPLAQSKQNHYTTPGRIENNYALYFYIKNQVKEQNTSRQDNEPAEPHKNHLKRHYAGTEK